MKVGLVMGAGGVVGASWLMGALEALCSETAWDPHDADFIVGTSAGAVVGALCAAGISPQHIGAYSSGASLEEFAEIEQMADEVAERAHGSEYRLARSLPSIGPGSWRMAVSTLLHPRQHTPATLLSAWLPRGLISTDPISNLADRFISTRWPEHPNFWAVACDYQSGRRVAFGRQDAPDAGIGEAVAASCAIPAFYSPVRIGGRRYIDGGVCSMSNLDLLAGRELDLVVCLNPTSSLASIASRSPVERLTAAVRIASGRRLGHEAHKLRKEGTQVLILQPTADDLAVMGHNMMARGRRIEVMEQAMISTAQQLRPLRGRPGALPGKRRSSRPVRRDRAA